MVVKKALTRKQIFIPSTVSFCVQEKGWEINKYWLQLETFQRCFKITEGLCYCKVLSLGLSRDFFLFRDGTIAGTLGQREWNVPRRWH
jgi:hypothetical protein